MKILLDIPEENLERLGELAKVQKRSRKQFMELILIYHAESAEDGSPETPQKSPIPHKELVFQAPKPKSAKKLQKNASDEGFDSVIQYKTPEKDYDAPKVNPLILDEMGQRHDIEINTDAVLAQIEAIKKETIPPERNTVIGKKLWKIEQERRLNELRSLLK